MKHRSRFLLATVLGGSGVALGVPAAFAQGPPAAASGVVTEANVQPPAGSLKVLNLHQRVVNDEDSGNCGYWALDTLDKHIEVWQEPDGSYYVAVLYHGFAAIPAGATSPGACVTQPVAGAARMVGGYVGTLPATDQILAGAKRHGDLGRFDLGGTTSDILLGRYSNGQKGDPQAALDAANWVRIEFGSTAGNVQMSAWGWQYTSRSNGSVWVDSNLNTTSGDLTTSARPNPAKGHGTDPAKGHGNGAHGVHHQRHGHHGHSHGGHGHSRR